MIGQSNQGLPNNEGEIRDSGGGYVGEEGSGDGGGGGGGIGGRDGSNSRFRSRTPSGATELYSD